jgi:hypothetical protein
MRKYDTFLGVIDKLPSFIEKVYNKKRFHSSLNYLPPEEFEDIYTEEKRNDLFLYFKMLLSDQTTAVQRTG